MTIGECDKCGCATIHEMGEALNLCHSCEVLEYCRNLGLDLAQQRENMILKALIGEPNA